jgi:hypothetical protein
MTMPAPTWSLSASPTGGYTILYGQADGTFSSGGPQDVGLNDYGEYGTGVAVADFYGDGHTGFAEVLGGAGLRVVTYPGEEVDYPAGLKNWNVVVADFNQDGIPDLAVTASDSGQVFVLLGRGNGDFLFQNDGIFAVAGAEGLATGDFNEDGIPDLVVTSQTNGSVAMLLGNGDGTFQAPRS